METGAAVARAREFRARSGSIREYLNRLFNQEHIEGDNGLNCIYPFSIPPERGLAITELCRALRPQATIEIGMAWGVSTLLTLEALTESGGRFAPHVVIDPFESTVFQNAALRAIRFLRVEDMVEFHEEPSEIVLPRMLAEGRRFDFAFIDGDHRFDAVFTDFRFIHMMLSPGGTILFDDTWLDSVHLAVRYAQVNLGYKETEIPADVPVYRGRPMLRAVTKQSEPVEQADGDGIVWNGTLKPFFDDLILDAEKSVRPARTMDDARELLDCLVGECRAARIVMKGGHYQLVETAVGRVREIIRAITEIVRVAETFGGLADLATVAEARKLLESVVSAFVSAHQERNVARIDEASGALVRLRAIFARRCIDATTGAP